MARPLLLNFFLLLSLALASGTELGEPGGGFAFTVPDGWQVREFPGLKYKIAHTAPTNGFAPNLNVLDEQFPGSIEDYAAANLKTLARVFAEFRNLGQSPFVTNAGLKGVRLVTQARQQKFLLRQIYYFLPGKGDKKYVVTFSALLEDGAKYDPVVDASVKTFTLR